MLICTRKCCESSMTHLKFRQESFPTESAFMPIVFWQGFTIQQPQSLTAFAARARGSCASRLFVLRMELKLNPWLQHPNTPPCVSASLLQPDASWSVMHPEQPKTGFALWRRRADSSPQGTLSTGLLQGLIQRARPPSFCFLLPRVHAADVASAQPAQMPSPSSSSSTSPVSAPIPTASTMPSNMGKPEFPDTGWDRIKDLFDRELVFVRLSVCCCSFHVYSCSHQILNLKSVKSKSLFRFSAWKLHFL